MPMPPYVTNENVRFNGTLDPAIVLKVIPNIPISGENSKDLILWNNLDSHDQFRIDRLVQAYGGVLPIPAPLPGKQVINFDGYIFAGTDLIDLVADNTSGFQIIDFSGFAYNTVATGLLNDATLYNVSISIDGTTYPIAITGSNAQTFGFLVVAINTAVGFPVATLTASGNILIESPTAGSTSVVNVIDTDLFSSCYRFSYIHISIPGGNGPLFTASIVIDGINHVAAIDGDVVLTFANLVTKLQMGIGVAGTVAIVSGNIEVTSATTGVGSTVVIVDQNLFRNIQFFVRINSTRPGASTIVEAMMLTLQEETGQSYQSFFHYLIKRVGQKPHISTSGPIDKNIIYFDGITWKYLFDGSLV